MGVRYRCAKCGDQVQYSPSDDEVDPCSEDSYPGCPADEPASPWQVGVIAAIGLGVAMASALAVIGLW